MGRLIVLEHALCPGDITVMTVVPREIYRQYGVKVGVCTNHPEIWLNNDYIAGHFLRNEIDPHAHQLVPIRYKVREHHNGAKQHFMHAYLRAAVEKIPAFPSLRLTELRPYLNLSDDERDTKPFNGRKYWLLNAGGKRDVTVKWWETKKWELATKILLTDVNFPDIVQIGKLSDWHPRIKYACDLRGSKVDLRTLIWLVYHSEGVMCPITAVMHMAAAFNKPCVVLAGGREAYWWDSYDQRMINTYKHNIPEEYKHLIDEQIPHKYLGNLPKCMKKGGGCWRNGVGEKSASRNCIDVIQPDKFKNMTIPQPRCLNDITPYNVVSAVRSYGSCKNETRVKGI